MDTKNVSIAVKKISRDDSLRLNHHDLKALVRLEAKELDVPVAELAQFMKDIYEDAYTRLVKSLDELITEAAVSKN